MAVNEDSWFEPMQDEIHEFDRLKCNRVLERQKKLRNQIFRALTASADVPSSVTETTDTTSTLPPPPPPLQKPTDKECKERSPPYTLRQKPGQYICCQNHKLIADIENDIMDPSGVENGGSQLQPLAITKIKAHFRVILRVLRIILVILPEHLSDTKDHLKMEMEDTSSQPHKGVKASANSDIIFFFTSAQDGNKLLDYERLSLADALKKAHDQNQNKSKWEQAQLLSKDQSNKVLMYHEEFKRLQAVRA
ncbi:hypothetical protein Tco_1031082 [Tanacetum coccineum]|uniref:Uncharacterized protein n=1 Tax=Tanacetum coccineum TaxID=301880 RepID=A0ABQ5G8B5_9ASTR